ncbi:MAG: hypothetical protein DRH30_00875 [Deltaproteobacteria bacterium]|nr:MAG: hypothetical protein DRH30_00875 [Deltaproteobacteria bacterium]
MSVDATATIEATGLAPKRKNLGPIVGGQFRHEVNDDETVTIFNVPIFATTKRGDFDYDDAWIDAAIENADKEYLDGHLPPMHMGHFDDERNPNPREVGAFKIQRKGTMMLGGKPVPVMYADLYVTDSETFAMIQSKRLRYRSVEANFDKQRIRSLALLDSEPPFHKLPMTTVSDDTIEIPDSLPGSLVVGFSESKHCQRIALEFPPMTVTKIKSNWMDGLQIVSFSDGEVRAYTPSGLDELRAERPELFAEVEESENEPGGEDSGDGAEAEDLIEEESDKAAEDAAEEEPAEVEEKMADEIKPGETSEGDDEESAAESDDFEKKPEGEEAQMGAMDGKSDTVKAIEALIDTLGDEAALKAIQALIETTVGEENGIPEAGAEVQGVPAIMSEGASMDSEKMSEIMVESRTRLANLEKFKADVMSERAVREAVASLSGRVTGEDIESELVKFAEEHGIKAMKSHAASLRSSLPSINVEDSEDKFAEGGAMRNVPDEVAKYRSKSPEHFEAAFKANTLFADGRCTSLSRERFIEIEVDRVIGS